jgi:hypothetical protein
MVVDFKMAESVAIKTFYSSELYEKLSNPSTLLWQKPWLDVYNMLKGELSD